MTEEMRKKCKMQAICIIAIAVLILVFAFYMGGVMQCLVTDFMNPKYDPASVLASMKENGIPWMIIGFFALVGEAALVAGVRKLLREQEGADTLGRFFHHALRHQVYGDSHFETPDEYEDAAWVQGPEDAYGPILGQVGTDGTKLINLRCDYKMRLNQHIMIVGASGSGKTYTFTKPYAYQAIKRRESVIFTDPDGGLTRTLANVFRENGYVVRVFNLNNLTKSDGWDCMKVIMDSDNKELSAQIFADTIISNIPGGKDKTQPIYRDGPLSLLKALLLRVATDEHNLFPNGKNIKSAYDILQNEDVDYMDKLFNKDIMSENEKISLGPYQSFKTASPNLRGNIITNLSTSLNLLQTKAVADVLSTDDIDLTLPGRQPCAYFCQFPDSHDTYKFIMSLFFSMLFMALTNYADSRQDNDGRLPVPVNFMLDEFPSIGVIPDFDRKMATIRKRAMNVAMIIQDMTQLQNNYPTTWTTLQANCSTFLALGINDQDTADMVTRRIGETTVRVETHQHKNFEGLLQTDNQYSTGEGKRALLQFDELFKLDKDDCLILLQYHNPIFAHKYPHVLHPMSKNIMPYDINRRPDLMDRDARLAEQEEERQRTDAYLSEHPLSDVDRAYKWMFGEDDEPSGVKKKKRRHGENAAADTEVEAVHDEGTEADPASDPSICAVDASQATTQEAQITVDPATGEVLSGLDEEDESIFEVQLHPEVQEVPSKANSDAGDAKERSHAWEKEKASYVPPVCPGRPCPPPADDKKPASDGQNKGQKSQQNVRPETGIGEPDKAYTRNLLVAVQMGGNELSDPAPRKTEAEPKGLASVRGFEEKHGNDADGSAESIKANKDFVDPTSIGSRKAGRAISTNGMYRRPSGAKAGRTTPPPKKKENSDEH